MAGLGGERALELAVRDRGPVARVVRLLGPVVLAQRVLHLRERLDPAPRAHRRRRAAQIAHELVDVLELLQGAPAGIPPPPLRAWREPDRERLGEVLVRMGLRVVLAQVLDVPLTRGVRAVERRLGPRPIPEPAPPPVTPP